MPAVRNLNLLRGKPGERIPDVGRIADVDLLEKCICDEISRLYFCTQCTGFFSGLQRATACAAEEEAGGSCGSGGKDIESNATGPGDVLFVLGDVRGNGHGFRGAATREAMSAGKE